MLLKRNNLNKRKSYSKDDIVRFKSEIDLCQVMKYFGFQHTRKSTRNAPQLHCKKTGEKYNISYKNNFYSYWSVSSPSMSGKPLPTIIDFLMSREPYMVDKVHSVDFYTALNWCDKAFNDKDFILSNENRIDSENSSVIYNSISNSLVDVKDFSFFSKRGIDKQTILDPRFFKCFAQYNYKPDGHQIGYTNFVSLLKDRKAKTQSLAVLNLFDKPKFNPSGNAMFYSVPQYRDENKNAVCDKLHILESSLDAVSKYELNKSLYDKDIFFSCEGAPSSYHAEFISEYINMAKPNKICFSTDKDPAGEMFACHFALNLNINKFLCSCDSKFSYQFNNAPFDIISGQAGVMSKDHLKNRHIAVCKFLVNGKSLENDVKMGVFFKNYFAHVNKSDNFQFLDNDHKFNVRFQNISDNSLSVNVSFVHSFLHWQQMNKFVHEYKFFNSKFLKRDLPVLKDYNDDLKAVKGLHKKFSIMLDDSFGKVLINKENMSFWEIPKCLYKPKEKIQIDSEKIKQARSKLQM